MKKRMAKKNLRKLEQGLACDLEVFFSRETRLTPVILKGDKDSLAIDFAMLLMSKMNLSLPKTSKERWSDGIGWREFSIPIPGSVILYGESWWGSTSDYSAGLVPEPLQFKVKLRSRRKKKPILYQIRLGYGPEIYLSGTDGIVTNLRLVDNIDVRNSYGETLLMHFLSAGNTQAVKYLCLHKVDVNTVSGGITALMLASMYGYEEIVQILLSNGARIDAQAEDGTTALMLASRFGHLNVVRALLVAGCDATIQTAYGETALKLASDRSYIEFRPYKSIVRMLNM